MYSDGGVHPLIEMIVVDPARRLAAGEAGEIAVRGPDQSVGYLRASDTDASRYDGRLLPGDIGTLCGRRVVTIGSGKKDIIIRKGENIVAKEREDLIAGIRPQVRVCRPGTARQRVPPRRGRSSMRVSNRW